MVGSRITGLAAPRESHAPGAAKPQTKSPWRFLCVHGAFAVKVRHTINREGAKSAKNLAKQNSFQESKDFRVSCTATPTPANAGRCTWLTDYGTSRSRSSRNDAMLLGH